MDHENIENLSLSELQKRLTEIQQARAAVRNKLWRHLGVVIVVVALTSATIAPFFRGSYSPAFFLATEGVAFVVLASILGRVVWLIRKRLDPLIREFNLYDEERRARVERLG